MLVIDSRMLEKVLFFAQREYPRECCGILLGRQAEGQRIAYKAIPIKNAAGKERSSSHFQMDPLDVMQAELSAGREELEIVGFYHSHPEYEAVPSEEDAHYMIPGCSYPILSIKRGKFEGMRSFEKLPQIDTLAQEEISIKEQ